MSTSRSVAPRLIRSLLKSSPNPARSISTSYPLFKQSTESDTVTLPPTKSKKELPSTPYTYSNTPQFPAPNDPFNPSSNQPQIPTTGSTAIVSTDEKGKGYSDSTKKVVIQVAKLLGYNSKASTAIRETGRMMRGIVESIERDKVYWYDQCALPPTYQTFFQLHLLYLLILLPRLRALPANETPSSHPVPEPLDPTPPSSSSSSSAPIPPSSNTSISPKSSSTAILSKPDYESFPTELINHFFTLAESEMRKVLGRGERERSIKKYMDEMGEQWKGAGVGLDYVLGLTSSESLSTPSNSSSSSSSTSAGQSESIEGQEEEEGQLSNNFRSDEELASWVWRNLFASKGLTASPLLLSSGSVQSAGKGDEKSIKGREDEIDLEMMARIEEIVVYIRKEMDRLDRIDSADILAGNIGEWGRIVESQSAEEIVI